MRTGKRVRFVRISATARHLGRERKTIRDYLSGKRVAPYDEVVAPGYRLSYQGFTRHCGGGRFGCRGKRAPG